MFTMIDFDKLQQIMDESPEKSKLIQKLLYSHKAAIRTISHEIRNPLTLVYSTIQLLEKQHPELMTYKYWPLLREDVEYMKLLLEELSSFHNGAQVSFSKVDTSTFLKSIVLSFASSLVETNISFSSSIAPNLPPIMADPVKLKEALLNLLRNATEAISTDGAITLRAQCEHNQLHIHIQDNGCGIPADKLERIFDPFITYKQSGTGLGLAIARQILLAHHGDLTVKSVEDVSSTFSLWLPIEQNGQQESR